MAQLWMIERDVAGLTDDDVEAATTRAKLCALWYPEMKWIRSYFDREGERTLCIYRAESEEDIRDHARVAGVTCGTVLLVEELLPGDFLDPTDEAVTARAVALGRPPLRDLATR